MATSLKHTASVPTAVQTGLFGEPAPVTPINARRRYTKFLRSIIGAGCDLIGLADRAHRALASSREHDARADAHVETIDRLAYRIAVEADANGHEALVLLAGRIRRECAGYREDDAQETHHVGLCASILARIVKACRELNTAITQRLSVLAAESKS